MAPYFGSTLAAHLSGEAVGLAILGRFDFAEQEYRLWLGNGRIELAGETWDGIGSWGGLSGISSGANDTAVPVTFTLSAFDDRRPPIGADMVSTLTGLLPKIRTGAPIRGRPVTVSLQFFSGETGLPLDNPAAIWTGKMDRVTASVSPTSVILNMDCEGLFANGSKPPAGLITHIDQQARFPGDMGCEFVANLQAKQTNWP